MSEPLKSPQAGEKLPEAMPDLELVQRILAGESQLFELVMRRYNQRLYRAARAILKDDAEAEDVMQEAYVRAYSHLRQWSGEAQFSTWLTKIAVHEALARVRKSRKFTDLELVSDEEHAMHPKGSHSGNPEYAAFSHELRALLEASVSALPEALRAAYVLRDVEGLSTAEAAECLEINEDALKTRLSRARSLLREELFERAGYAAPDLFTFGSSRCDLVVVTVMQRLT